MEIDGFREGVKHVRQNHPDTLFEDKACPCVICPKRFARMDHLKNHVYSHVNRIRPGMYSYFHMKPLLGLFMKGNGYFSEWHDAV